MYIGTPRAPQISEVMLVNDNKDLLIGWNAEATELRPIDSYTGVVHIRSQSLSVTKRQADPDVLRFETNDTRKVLPDVDLTKEYEIQICSRNEFGSACSDPVVFAVQSSPTTKAPVPVATVVQSSPITGGTNNEKEETGVASWLIALIVIMLLFLLLLCCLLLLIVLCCFLKERGKSYFPEKRGRNMLLYN